MRPAHRNFLFLGAFTAVASAVRAQTPPGRSPCDEALLRLAAPVNGYQPRGDRCEGLYARQVSGTTLFLASFTRSFENYDLQSPDPLVLSWPATPDSAIQIRAETVGPNRYYRMDTRRLPGDTIWRWPSRVLTAERISRKELGILGWRRMVLKGRARPVYMPLEVNQRNLSAVCGPYEIVLSPGARLSEVTLTLAKADADGNPERYIKQDEPLQRGFYPAGSPILVTLKRGDLLEPGLYYLKVTATLRTKGAIAQEYFLQVVPDSRCPN